MNHIAMKQNSRYLLIILTVFMLGVITSCKKTETNPCEGLLSEGPPSEIIVKIIDKQTKETLVIDAATIKITEKQSGKLYTNWNVHNRTNLPQLTGAISLAVFNETPGEYQFTMQIGNAGMATLSYKISREETDNPCRPFSYPMRDIKIIDQPFEVFRHDGKSFPTILVVAL